MRYLPGQPQDISNESITSRSLMEAAVANADVLPTVWELWGNEETPLSSILNMKGLKTKGLFDGYSGQSMRVVKSNHVQYAIKNTDKRKVRFKANAQGKTFICDAYPTEPGKNQSGVYIFLDSNWPGGKEVLELNDNETKVYIIDEELPVEVDGCFRYLVKIVTKVKTDFIAPELMDDNSEVGIGYTMYEQDFSETGNEKYTYDGWGHAYMTLQRMKYSWSGTAEAMGTSKLWTIHNGEVSYLTKAENDMMKRAAQYHEYALIHGKGTVTVDGEVLMHDKKGREIMAGDGILHQGEGAYEYPYNEMTLKFLENIMSDADIRVGGDGLTEVVYLASRKGMVDFSRMMRENNFVTQNHNIEGTGADKGVNNSYAYYELGGVRVIPRLYRWFSDPGRPSVDLPSGERKGDFDGIFIPIGKTSGGDNGIELVQLRPPKVGTVNGINVGGDMATSVDGSHKHVLFQTGVVSRARISRIFHPYPHRARMIQVL